jgi:gliding motility-associated-like protein
MDTIICNNDTVTLDIFNPNISVIGQWVYDVSVEADPAISGAYEGGTNLTDGSLTQTLTNTDTVNRKVVYRFSPKILLNGGPEACENGELIVTVWVRPSLETFYSPVVSDYNGYNISCYESSDGYIALRVQEGTQPLYFDWTGPDGFASDENVISQLGPGTYALTVTDDNNCTFTNEYVFIQPDELGADFTLSTSFDGGYNIDCAGGRTGTIDVEPFNYVDSVSYFWNDGSIEGNRTDLPAGVHNLIIVDKNNCWFRTDITLTEPEPIRLFADTKIPFCPDSPDGEIEVGARGGIEEGGYSYLWSNDQTSSTIIELVAGPYTVTVTDMNNCTADSTVELIPLNNHCLIIPNAISPNGDMINDVWNLGFTEIYPEMTVLIFNMWGQLVWESEPGYFSPWDGTSNGKLLPVDSYFYVINLHDGETEPITGHVSLIY